MAKDYTNIGLVYYDMCEYNFTLTYHNKALGIDERLNDTIGMAKDYTNIGLVYFRAGEYHLALTYHNKALGIDERLNDTIGMAKDYKNIELLLDHVMGVDSER